MVRTTTEVIDSHLSFRLKGDVDHDIATNFHSEVIILSSFGTFRGHDGVRESAHKLKESLGPAVYHYNRTLIEDNFAFLEWSGESKEKMVSDGADAFIVEDGLIRFQAIHYSPRRI